MTRVSGPWEWRFLRGWRGLARGRFGRAFRPFGCAAGRVPSIGRQLAGETQGDRRPGVVWSDGVQAVAIRFLAEGRRPVAGADHGPWRLREASAVLAGAPHRESSHCPSGIQCCGQQSCCRVRDRLSTWHAIHLDTAFPGQSSTAPATSMTHQRRSPRWRRTVSSLPRWTSRLASRRDWQSLASVAARLTSAGRTHRRASHVPATRSASPSLSDIRPERGRWPRGPSIARPDGRIVDCGPSVLRGS